MDKDVWAENAKAVVAVCGWPEWDGRCWGEKAHLNLDRKQGWSVWYTYRVNGSGDRGYAGHLLTHHEAACIWRDWVLRQLTELGLVNIKFDDRWRIIVHFADESVDSGSQETYDSALIKLRLAVEAQPND